MIRRSRKSQPSSRCRRTERRWTPRLCIALASTSHFIHPIPERGLKRRLRRIKAETLVLWGAQDALVPPSYAAEFAALIPNACVEMIQAAGHVPQIEQRRLVSDHLTKFLTRG